MLRFYKISLIVSIILVCSEGKVKNNAKTLPIEVLLNSESEGRIPVPETTFLKNKAIELKIRSDDNKNGGNVDLIIQATKEIQATEAKINRYSPAFNSEFSLNNKSPGDLKSGLKLNRNWEASRQDFNTRYPTDGTELFPLLMLRQILQTPHPLVGQNQFAPSQNLRHFEDNLYREMMPFQRGWEPAHKLPMHLVVSQPIFTRASPNVLNQQHLSQTPHFLNMLHNGLVQNGQPLSFNLPPGVHQTNTLAHNLPANRYALNPSVPQTGYLNNHNYPKNNDLLNLNPIHHNPKSQHLHVSSKSNEPIVQSIPNILGNNKTPLPNNNHPDYSLQRNLQKFNTLVDKPVHPQNISPYHSENLHSIPKLHDHGNRNYQQNRDTQLPNYKQTITQQPNQNLYHIPLQRPLHHHHQQSYNEQRLPRIHPHDLNVYSNNQQYPNHQRNIPPTDLQRDTLSQNYRPILREFPVNNQPLNNQNLHHLHHEHSSPQSLSNDYRNHASSNEPINKTPEDDKKIPMYYRSPEGSRPLYHQSQSHETPDSQKYHSTTEQSYSRSSSLSSSSSPNQDHYYSEPETAHRDTYQEPSYGSHTRSSSIGLKEPVNQSDDIVDPERSNYDESYISTKPIKKRKSRKKKRYETKENMEDLDGHSSHQYIIKIG